MKIPYLGIHLKTINTFYHEVGHAVAALIFNGEIYHIKLNINNSGEALTSTKGWFAKFFVAISGYIFPLFLAMVLLVLVYYRHLYWAFYGLFVLAVSSTILWIRNSYGYIWSIGYIFVFSCFLYFKSIDLIKILVAFNLGALLVENIFATVTLIKIGFKNPKQAGDAYNLKQYTFIPTFFWCIFFFLMSTIVLVASLFCANKLIL